MDLSNTAFDFLLTREWARFVIVFTFLYGVCGIAFFGEIVEYIPKPLRYVIMLLSVVIISSPGLRGVKETIGLFGFSIAVNVILNYGVRAYRKGWGDKAKEKAQKVKKRVTKVIDAFGDKE